MLRYLRNFGHLNAALMKPSKPKNINDLKKEYKKWMETQWPKYKKSFRDSKDNYQKIFTYVFVYLACATALYEYKRSKA